MSSEIILFLSTELIKWIATSHGKYILEPNPNPFASNTRKTNSLAQLLVKSQEYQLHEWQLCPGQEKRLKI